MPALLSGRRPFRPTPSRIRRYLVWQTGITAVLAVLLTVDIAFGGASSVLALGLLLGLLAMLGFALHRERQGDRAQARLIDCAGLLMAAFLGVLVAPGSLPLVYMAALLGAAIGLPALRARDASLLPLLAWLIVIATTLFTRPILPLQPSNLESSVQTIGMMFVVGLALWFVLLYHRRVSALQADLRQAHALNARARAEGQFRLLFEETKDVVVVTTPNGKMLDINQAGVNLFGFESRDELLALDDISCLYTNSDDRELLKRELDQHGFVQNMELHLRRRDSQPIYVQETATAIRDDEGATIAYHGIIRDITSRKQAEAALRASETRFRTLVANLAGAVYRCTTSDPWHMDYVSEAIEEISGYPAVDFVGIESRTFGAIIHAEDRDTVNRTVAEHIQAGQGYALEYKIVHANGSIRWVRDQGVAVLDEQGTIEYLDGVLFDITHLKSAETALQESNLRLVSSVAELERRTGEMERLGECGEMLQACRSPDEAYNIVAHFARQLFPHITGACYIRSESSGQMEQMAAWGASATLAPSFAPEQCWAVRRGRIHGVLGHSASPCTHSLYKGHNAICVPLISRDEVVGVLHLCQSIAASGPTVALGVSDERLASTFGEQLALALSNLFLRETLRLQAVRDPITGLFNRRYMEESLERELRRATRNGTALGVMMIDIDHFKQFNDTYGHAAGDAMLREMGAFLKKHIRAEDVPCRYGGEEFLLILPDAALLDLVRRAEDLRSAVDSVYIMYSGQKLGPITLSIGVAAFPDHSRSAETLLHAADMALYQAKASGRNQVVTAEGGVGQGTTFKLDGAGAR